MLITKKDLHFYIAADRIMAGRTPFPSIIERLKETVVAIFFISYSILFASYALGYLLC